MSWHIQPQLVAAAQTCKLTYTYAANNFTLMVVAVKAKIELIAIYAVNIATIV